MQASHGHMKRQDHSVSNPLNFKLAKNNTSKKKLMKSLMRKSKFYNHKSLAISTSVSKRKKSKESIEFTQSRISNRRKMQTTNIAERIRYGSKLGKSSLDTKQRMRSATPDLLISSENLNNTISKYLSKAKSKNSALPTKTTECATPVKLNNKECCARNNSLCSCPIMVSAPQYLLKKLQACSNLESYTLGLNLLKENSNKQGYNFISKIEESVESNLKNKKQKISDLEIKCETLAKHVAELYKEIEGYKTNIEDQGGKIEELEEKCKVSYEEKEEFQNKYQEIQGTLQKLDLKYNKMQEKLKTSKLYEKRLMYLIYLSVEEGYPVDKLYEEKVGNLSTRVFEDISHHHDSSLFTSCLISEIPRKESEVRIVDEEVRSSQIFDSSASYSHIKYETKPKEANKPSFVKTLDLEKVSDYNSTVKILHNSLEGTGFIEAGVDPLVRFRKCRSHDDIYLSICSPSNV